MRHNGRPARVKLVRADINPPGDFNLSEDLPRFSQGNEPPLNLTEKVNRVVMERMRAAKNNGKEKPDDQKAREPKQSKHVGKRKGPEKPPKTVAEVTAKDSTAAINNQLPDSGELKENVSKQSATQLDSLEARRSPESAETSDDRRSDATEQKQRDKLEWFSTWEEE